MKKMILMIQIFLNIFFYEFETINSFIKYEKHF